jgi:hypothetical protein
MSLPDYVHQRYGCDHHGHRTGWANMVKCCKCGAVYERPPEPCEEARRRGARRGLASKAP